ncbi:MarR family winged helix-turn-helix transcriptional regulator [Bradyrhizobium sp. AZCC 2289]|uniref:MarR family winged helix-turn-helix transcriptional regulator n=1 Tax=Bradyrhizobium sp. AZCC 2289 TaxID=3117026 RepID=UPI002FEFA6DF
MKVALDRPPSLDKASSELLLAIGQLVRKLRSQSNPNEMNLSQMSALARLEQFGPMTTADLSRAEAMKPQSMGTILASLEQDGFVHRQPHPTDGRQILFALTDKGKEERRQRGIAKRVWLAAAMAKFTPAERQTLNAAIPLMKRLGDG